MLKNDFFKLHELNTLEKEGHFRAMIELNENHSIFKGHFPETPVVPGVCIIQMIKEISSEILKKELTLTKGSNIKYMSVINPLFNKIIFFDLHFSPSDDNISLFDVKVYFEELKFCSIKGIFRLN